MIIARAHLQTYRYELLAILYEQHCRAYLCDTSAFSSASAMCVHAWVCIFVDVINSSINSVTSWEKHCIVNYFRCSCETLRKWKTVFVKLFILQWKSSIWNSIWFAQKFHWEKLRVLYNIYESCSQVRVEVNMSEFIVTKSFLFH